MALCKQRNAAVQTIKAIARGPWATTAPRRDTWYEPLEEQDDIDRAVHWVLARGDVFLVSVGDMALLPKVLDAASRCQSRPSEVDMERLSNARRITSLFGIGT